MTSNLNKLKYSVLLAMFLPFAASLVYFVFFKESLFAQVTYMGTKIFTLLWPIAVYKFVLKTKVPSITIKYSTKRILGQGLVSGLVIAGLILILANTILTEVVLNSAPQILAKVEQLGIRKHYILFAIFLSWVHSLLEEYYWRWFVFGSLVKLTSNCNAHLFAALAFTSHHVVILSQFVSLGWIVTFSLAVFTGGLLWSWMYSKHGSLLGAWISHVFVDIGIMAVGYKIISS